jgi:Ca2+-binding RTX toxin-like protein
MITIFKPGSASLGSIASAFGDIGGIVVHTAAEWEVKDQSTHQDVVFLSADDSITYLPPPPPVNEVADGGTISSITMNDGPSYTKHWALTDLTFDLGAAIAFAETHPSAPAVIAYLINAFWGGDDTFIGSSGGDVLNSYAGDDRLIGRGGNNTMRGGAGNDTFVFQPHFGHDVIKDFSATVADQDVIEMHHLFHTLAAVKRHSHVDAQHHLVIVFDAADSITLTTVHSKASLTAADFHFFA